MRPVDCATCDLAAAKTAQLLVWLRKAAAQLHRALGHRTLHWMDCSERPCREYAAAAKST